MSDHDQERRRWNPLPHEVRTAIAEEVERGLPPFVEDTNEFGGRVQRPSDRLARDIAQRVYERLSWSIDVSALIEVLPKRTD